jgi:hypothetical protein
MCRSKPVPYKGRALQSDPMRYSLYTFDRFLGNLFRIIILLKVILITLKTPKARQLSLQPTF